MMPRCAVKNCENQALVSYGGRFICGDCMCRILEGKRQKEQKEIEELEEEKNKEKLTRREVRVSTHRTRDYSQYIKLGEQS